MVALTACENNGDPVELTRRFDQMTKLRSGRRRRRPRVIHGQGRPRQIFSVLGKSTD